MLKIIETTIIKISLPNEQNLFIISAYAAGHNKANFAKVLNIIFNGLKLYDSNNWYLLAGDLNARHLRWQDNYQNPRGLYLNNWLNINNMKFRTKLVGPVESTYPSGNSYLDLCLHDNRIKIQNLSNERLKTFPYDSDHKGIQINFSLQDMDDLTLESASPHYRLNFNKTD